MTPKTTKNKLPASNPTPASRYGRAKTFILTDKFAKYYALVAVAILALSTVFWALLSARLQSGNADQLVDPYLFKNSATFHQATFPGTHSFLLKWPLFLIVRLLGLSSGAFTFVTILTTLLTVGGLAYLLFRIERRPLYFGTLCIALASMLLLVPAVPYAGGILPVNMAMLATRNLEYIVYIASLVLLIRRPGFKSPSFWAGLGLLTLLIASDKLFLTLSVGGALIGLIVYALVKGWSMVSLSVNWLVGTLVAGLGAILLLELINASGLTNITGGTSANPYGLINSLHQLVQAVVFGATGIASNFGANPGFDATVIRTIPHLSAGRVFGAAGPEFIINFFVFLIALYAAGRLVYKSLRLKPKAQDKLGTPFKLSLILIWSFVAAAAVFVFSNHYYPVDARYLTIGLFALMSALATASRTQTWRPEKTILAGAIISLSMLMGVFGLVGNYHTERAALADVGQRNSTVAQALNQHQVDVLVGDYWRVMPIGQEVGSQTQVLPLANCSSPRDVLSSGAWQLDLHTHSFAYLLSLDKSLKDYPTCSLNDVVNAYGRPNASTLISGTLLNPKEVLLYYDHGIHITKISAPGASITQPTLLPISLDMLPHTFCPTPTTLNVVAHQDDDLLFMNPDIMHDIAAGRCVRTVYITAGDGGNDSFYWLRREQGSEAAYSYMAGLDDIWTQRTISLNSHEFITIANPRGNDQISLVFMQLPDGNIWGQGFARTKFESLSHLADSKATVMHSIDGQSSYTEDQLNSALVSLMSIYSPA